MEEICLKLNLFKKVRDLVWNAQNYIKMTFQSHIRTSVLLFLEVNAKDPL